jgi:2-oxoglutarate dehydrogenase E2 component (dihydrolipoamide succinyltransferase)
VNKYGIKLGFMSFFIKAAVAALQEYPIVNAVIDGTNMIQRNYIDISIAVATPTGLMVPVLRNCHTLKLHEIELVSHFLIIANG